MTNYQRETIKELASAIRSQDSGTTFLFLSAYEVFPKTVWGEAVQEGILTPREYQACILVLKSYRKLQAIAEIEDA